MRRNPREEEAYKKGELIFCEVHGFMMTESKAWNGYDVHTGELKVIIRMRCPAGDREMDITSRRAPLKRPSQEVVVK